MINIRLIISVGGQKYVVDKYNLGDELSIQGLSQDVIEEKVRNYLERGCDAYHLSWSYPIRAEDGGLLAEIIVYEKPAGKPKPPCK